MPFGDYKDFDACVAANKDKDDPKAYCATIMRKVEGKQEADSSKEFEKESKEHPTLPKSTVKQIVLDHISKEKKAQLCSSWKKTKTNHRKRIVINALRARLSSLGSIPIDYKKKLDRAKHTHGQDLPKTAFHSGIGMEEYTLVDVCFLKEGEFRTNGVPYHYDWETIERDGKSFEGKGFFINHDETNGKEVGIIDKVYTAIHEGTKWLCAKIKVPEAEWTKAFLERMQTGLIHDISSTHDFYVDPEDQTRTVSKMVGKGLSTVKEGEVSGARIIEIKRNLKNN